MIVALDTNVLVAGLRSRRGASYRILELIPTTRFSGVISVALFLEYEAVLKRAEFLPASGLTVEDVDVVLDMIADRFRTIAVHYLWRPQLRDADDEMVLELAVNGGAGVIVTFNPGDFRPAADKFGVDLMSPGAFVRALGKEQGP